MRKEKDFLGELELPDDVYYGIQTMRAVQNFPITGYHLDTEFIKAMAIVKKAAALANMKTGQLSEEIGQSIVAAAEEIIYGNHHDQFVVDCIQGGAGTSMNMNMNEVLANLALEKLGGNKGDYHRVSPNNHVNMAQSTNDCIPTAIRLTTVRKADQLVEELMKLWEELGRKSVEFSEVVKMGRTHLQDAVPITLGQEFTAYSSMVRRAANRIQRVRKNLLSINMGATAVGTGLNADPEYIEEVVRQIGLITGEEYVSSSNLVDATQNTDELAEVSGALKVCALSLSKMANDLRLMASGPKCGFNEIVLPARQPGSSIMPGKVNPVIPEMMNQIAFQVVGNDVTIGMAVEAGQFELNVMEPVIAFNLFGSLRILANGVKVLREKCICDIQANDDRCREMVDKSVGIITALSPHIGYEQACAIAKEALSLNESVKSLVLKRCLIPAEQIDVILSPGEMCKPGIPGKDFLSTKKQKAV